MAKRLCALVALLIMSTFPAYAAEYLWTKPGIDPCRKNPKCTLESTLKQSGWTENVQSTLIALTKSVTPETMEIVKGDTFDFMAFGARPGTERVVKNVVAAWKEGHKESARMWVLEAEGFRYELIVPNICSNYSGRKVKLPPKVEKKVEAPKPVFTEPAREKMPRGIIPITTCVEE